WAGCSTGPPARTGGRTTPCSGVSASGDGRVSARTDRPPPPGRYDLENRRSVDADHPQPPLGVVVREAVGALRRVVDALAGAEEGGSRALEAEAEPAFDHMHPLLARPVPAVLGQLGARLE